MMFLDRHQNDLVAAVFYEGLGSESHDSVLPLFDLVLRCLPPSPTIAEAIIELRGPGHSTGPTQAASVP